MLEYRDQGYVPDAVVNFLALLGWSLDDKTDIIDRETLITHFDVDRLLPNPAVFNAEKLLWMNGVYIREMRGRGAGGGGPAVLGRPLGVRSTWSFARIVPLVQERIKLLREIVEMADFFFVEGDLDTASTPSWARATPAILRGREALERPDRAIEARPAGSTRHSRRRSGRWRRPRREGGRPLRGRPRRSDRQDGDAAAVRDDGGPRPGAHD